MKKHWAFVLSLALGGLALCLEWRSNNEYIDASKQLTEGFVHHFDPATGTVGAIPYNPAAQALLHRSEVLSHLAFPAAGISAVCLFLSHLRKETAWRWIVGLVLFLYAYLVLGPI